LRIWETPAGLAAQAVLYELQKMDDHYIGTIAPQNLYVRSLYDYQADDAGSLSFRQGDVIQVLNQLDNGWWDGWLHGVRGWFPSNYCEPITQNDLQTLDQEGLSEDEDYDLDDDSDGDYEVYLDEGYRDIANETVDGANGVGRRSEHEGLWIPQASADGEMYYFNTVTGDIRREPVHDCETSGDAGRRLPPELVIGGSRDVEYGEIGSEAATLIESSSFLVSLAPNKKQNIPAKEFLAKTSSKWPLQWCLAIHIYEFTHTCWSSRWKQH